MSKGLLPSDPSRADYRMIRKLVEFSTKKGKYIVTPQGCDRIGKVFQRCGGSWERLFLGSTRDLTLLKKIVKVALKAKVFDREPTWY